MELLYSALLFMLKTFCSSEKDPIAFETTELKLLVYNFVSDKFKEFSFNKSSQSIT